jgi:hypothetical protein
MTKRRDHGDGSIDARGENSWRLRYRISGKRFTKTFRGSLSDARKELRRLIHSGDSGDHVAPDKMTLGQWIKHWLAIGAPGKRRRREVGARSLERYSEMLCLHVVGCMIFGVLTKPCSLTVACLSMSLPPAADVRSNGIPDPETAARSDAGISKGPLAR